jgi:hypothetical protein
MLGSRRVERNATFRRTQKICPAKAGPKMSLRESVSYFSMVMAPNTKYCTIQSSVTTMVNVPSFDTSGLA